MELDKALEFATILAWKDLTTGDQLMSARVQYESTREAPLDSLSVWTLRSWGYQDRVCDYRTRASSADPVGASFTNGYHSDILAHTLDFITKNLDQFTLPVDAWRTHLVLIQPPTADRVAEAAFCMTRAQEAVANRAGGAEAQSRNGEQNLSHRSNGAASDPRITPS